ncbi:MAG: ATP-dependent nuclease subunit B [Ruminococcaceae bacterium]|nr:ATP-dependent nuclease subunit B [Oscillospiraceae bacterium]
MLKLILGRAKSGKTAAIMEEIHRRLDEPDGAVLLVPEQYSHEAEREMLRICGARLCLGAEVLSFTRLALRVESELGGAPQRVLDAGGRMLCLARAAEAVGSRMRAFGAARRQVALQQRLLRAIDECRTCRVTPEALEALAGDVTLAPGLRDKLADLSLLYSAYIAIAARSGLDPMSRLDTLAVRLPESAYAARRYYIDGFTDFTAQEMSVIEALLRAGADVTVCLTAEGTEEGHAVFEPSRRAAVRLLRCAEALHCPAETLLRTDAPGDAPMEILERELFSFGSKSYDGRGQVQLLCARDVTDECACAAERCLALVRETGCRWRDIAVAARDYGAYRAAMESIFAYYGVPLYAARKSDLSEKPLIALIAAAYAVLSGGWDYDDVMAYCKTGLTGLSAAECDELENYAFLWTLRGSAWTKAEDWTAHPDGFSGEDSEDSRARLARVNALRRRVTAPLMALQAAGAQADTGRAQAMALADFFDALALPELLKARAEALQSEGLVQAAAEYVQLWEIVAGALEQSAAILGDTPMDTETFGQLFCQMLSAYDVGSIPLSLDRVSAGDMDRMRRRHIRHLIVLGCDSDTLPSAAPDGSIFSDDDREALRGAQLELGSTAGERLDREFALIYNCLTLPSDSLCLSWAAAAPDGARAMPSFVVSRTAALFSLPYVHPDMDEVRAAAPAPAFELAASAMAGDATPLRSAALDYFSGREQELEKLRDAAHLTRGRLSRSAVRALYGDTLRLSASRVDKLASCGFAFFLQYGLKARPRQPAQFRAPEMGTFLHYVLEHVARDIADGGGFAAAEEKRVHELCDKYVSEYIHDTLNDFREKSPRFVYLFRRLITSVRAVVGDMAAELAKSDFVPLDFELDFSDREAFPPVRLGEGDDALVLTGVADRVDGWVHDGKLYLRVVDYKTGKKSFSLSDVWYGLGLQMLLYLFALQRSGEARYGREIVPAGVLYVPARDVLLSADGPMSAGEILAEKAKARRRSGLVLAEDAALRAMEHGDAPQFLPVKLKGGAFSGDALASAEQLGLLSRHIDETLRALARELRAGSVAADPWYRSQTDTACRFCDYAAACHFNESDDRIRYVTRLRPQQVWELLQKQKEAQP